VPRSRQLALKVRPPSDGLYGICWLLKRCVGRRYFLAARICPIRDEILPGVDMNRSEIPSVF